MRTINAGKIMPYIAFVVILWVIFISLYNKKIDSKKKELIIEKDKEIETRKEEIRKLDEIIKEQDEEVKKLKAKNGNGEK